MKNNKKTLLHAGLAFAGAAAAMAFPEMSFAKDLAALAQHGTTQFQAVSDLLTTGAYVVGAGSGVQSALKFKEHSDNPQNVKLKTPVIYALVAGTLLGLPSFLGSSVDTMGFENGNAIGQSVLGGSVVGK